MHSNIFVDINHLVLNHTRLKDGHSLIYPSLTDLMVLLNHIIEMEQTTDSLSVTPFYINEKANLHEEFDFGGLYIECRDFVTAEEADNFWLDSKFWGWLGAEYNLLSHYVTDDDLKKSQFLCQKDDITRFHQIILTYQDFLMRRGIPQMMAWLYDLCGLRDEDLAYGYFCFEVYSD